MLRGSWFWLKYWNPDRFPDTAAGTAATDKQFKQVCPIIVAAALRETAFIILANPTVPDSSDYPFDGVGKDHDSVGILQQRPSAKEWGNVADCMSPSTNGETFTKKLLSIKGWNAMAPGTAAQKVQRSDTSDAYDDHVPRARKICDAWKLPVGPGGF